MESLIALIYNFYPKNISAFDDAYDFTPEYFNRRNAIKKEDPRWPNLLTELLSKFRSEYVRDITCGEPANTCAIYIFKQDLIYEVTIHISKLADYYSFYVKKAFVDKINLYTKELEKVMNTGLPEIETEIEFILNAIQRHFNHSLIPQHISDTLIPDICTQDKGFGKTTIFDALFGYTDF